MRALLALIPFLLAAGCISSPSGDGLADAPPDTAQHDAGILDVATIGSSRSAESAASLRVTSLEPVVLGLFVPQDHRVVLQFEILDSAYAGFTIDGPGTCSSTQEAGVGVDPATDSTAIILQCGELETGWYEVHVSIDAGVARGLVDSSGAFIFAPQE
jgi:hypothetical protein